MYGIRCKNCSFVLSLWPEDNARTMKGTWRRGRSSTFKALLKYPLNYQKSNDLLHKNVFVSIKGWNLYSLPLSVFFPLAYCKRNRRLSGARSRQDGGQTKWPRMSESAFAPNPFSSRFFSSFFVDGQWLSETKESWFYYFFRGIKCDCVSWQGHVSPRRRKSMYKLQCSCEKIQARVLTADLWRFGNDAYGLRNFA